MENAWILNLKFWQSIKQPKIAPGNGKCSQVTNRCCYLGCHWSFARLSQMNQSTGGLSKPEMFDWQWASCGNLIRLGLENISASTGTNSQLLITLCMSKMLPALAKCLRDLCEALPGNCEQVGLGQPNYCTPEPVSASRKWDNEASCSSNRQGCMKSCCPKHSRSFSWPQRQKSLPRRPRLSCHLSLPCSWFFCFSFWGIETITDSSQRHSAAWLYPEWLTMVGSSIVWYWGRLCSWHTSSHWRSTIVSHSGRRQELPAYNITLKSKLAKLPLKWIIKV